MSFSHVGFSSRSSSLRATKLRAFYISKIMMILLLLLLLLFPTTTTAQWYKQSSGTCTTPIATAAECKTATTMWNGSPRTTTASTLQPRNTIVTEVDLSDEPAGCIATNFAKTGDPNTGGMAVRFNTNAVTTVECDGGTACMCKYAEGCPVNTYTTTVMI